MRKDDWLSIADHYGLTVKKTDRKSQIKNLVINYLFTEDILPEQIFDLCDDDQSPLALKQLELKYAREKDELERKDRLEREEKERQFQLQMLELKLRHKTGNETDENEEKSDRFFDLSKVVKLVPIFDESDPDEFFSLFEKLANSLKWPESLWPVILQSGLKGKGRTAFLALTDEEGRDYNVVKDSILRAYELTSEYYRSNFRKYRKLDSQSYMEYAHNVTKLHEKCFVSDGIQTLQEYKELIILEQFLRGIPIEVKNYLNEKEVTTMHRAATLAENFSLISTQKKKKWHPKNSPLDVKGEVKNSSRVAGVDKGVKPVVCYKCGNTGHISRFCKNGQLKDSKGGATSLAVISPELDKHGCSNKATVGPRSSFDPFIFTGYVSLSEGDNNRVPVRIMRDTASSHSLVIGSSVPWIREAMTEKRMILSGIGGVTSVPLCELYLDCGLVSNDVTLGVKDFLPIDGVDVLMGNDIAGEKIVPDPIVVDKPLDVSPTAELEIANPNLFPSCVLDSVRLVEVCSGCKRLDDFALLSDCDKVSEGLGINPQNAVSCDDSGTRGVNESSAVCSKYDDNDFVHESETCFDVTTHDKHSSEAAMDDSCTDTAIAYFNDSAVKARLGTDMPNVNFGNCEQDSPCDFTRDYRNISSAPSVTVGENVSNPQECNGFSNEFLTGQVLTASIPNMTRSELVSLQRADPDLHKLYEIALPDSSISTERTCFYLKNDVLMRKFRSIQTPTSAAWDVYYQVVVPKALQRDLIQLAHEGTKAHLGIKKTAASILRYFYWRNIWKDVGTYCKCCEVCQRTGKPNLVLKPVPLTPIPVVSEPLTKIIILCGTSSQNQKTKSVHVHCNV